ncbi:TonB-dependent receptor (plasmid) [Polymorphobacter sp. PAMC 29334]|uniref:TonB-dependent receptor n=1 Tax=Polymorphobacter sp. PAMC 29334 TaxID=2862331 RepID=UPI001C7488DF|nr:TonB-dependent receptor [Polymorphobacter sp. PAMC 29334]QYE37093.1 TonB-dependent receptor [Polymorphobacter sp. PAMC 29334]
MSNFAGCSCIRARLLHGTAVGLGLIAAAAGAQTTAPTTPNVDPTSAVTTQAGALPASAVPTPNQHEVDRKTVADAAVANDEIVVTGLRAGLANAARTKRDAVLIVESVSAEDVGKLPDVSIADSLARLPGVTAQRLDGRDQNLSIRGLGPDFSTTLLNGREQVTTGDNRGVEFDQYPSEFFKNVNVYKTADAALIAAGVAGTIDLRTIRPLSVPDRVIALSARGQLNEIKALNPDSPRAGYRASATYVDKFLDDTLGIAIGVAATQAPTQNERYNAWGYSGSGTATDPYILGGAKPYVDSELLKRYGGVATIEYQPSETWHSTFDALYSHFEDTQHLRGIEFPFSFGGATLANATFSNGFVTSGTFTPNFAVQRNDYNRRNADDLSLGWNNDFKIGEKVHLNIDASWSRAKRTDFLLEDYTGTGYNQSGPKDTVKFSQNANGTFNLVPTQDYTNTTLFKITDPGGWGYNGTTAVVQSGFLNRPSFKDDLKSIRASLNGEFDNTVFKGWEAGFNFSRREKTSAYTSYFLCPKGGGTGCTVASGTPTSEAIPAAAVIGSVPLGYLGVPAVIALNPTYLYDNAYNSVLDNRPVSLVRDNMVIENVYTGYAKLNIDTVAGDAPVKGSLGFQVIHTDQSSNGTTSTFNPATGVVNIFPLTDNSKYTYFLPSGTLSIELRPSFFAKLGASETIVRPRLDQERVNQELDVNYSVVTAVPQPITNRPFSYQSGNVNLRPYRSVNVDISFEKYFKGGYVAVAGYFKRLTNYVDASASTLTDFSTYTSLFPAGTVFAPGNLTGLNNQPNNDGRGYLAGVEGTVSVPFSLVTHVLDGFGVFATGTYTKSEIKLGTNPIPITLPGLSKYVWSGTAYYEKNGIQVRAVYRYRSDFLGEVAGLSAAPTYRNVVSEGILDAQVGYEFQNGFLKGLSILAQAKNLTDRPFITYQNNDRRQLIDYQRYGRDYYLGFAYKF